VQSYNFSIKGTMMQMDTRDITYLQLCYREAIMTFKCMKGMAPTYLSLQFVRGGSVTEISQKIILLKHSTS
jgi:hypothetical protein